MSVGPTTKIKVVLVISSLRGGGAERVMSNMANYWSEKSVEVSLITLDDHSGDDDFYKLHPGVKRIVWHFPPGKNSFTKALRLVQRIIGIRRVLRSAQPNSVLSFMTTVNVLTIIASLGLPVRCVVSERTNPSLDITIKPIWALARRRLYRLADHIVAQTPDISNWLSNHVGADVTTIPNFIRDMPLNTLEKENLILGVGRLSHEKGFDLLIKAFALIRSKYPDWRLVLVGDGPDLTVLKNICTELNLDQAVEFVGVVEDVERWQARASIVVQPSRFEGFPNVVLEAMAMSAAVITSTAAGASLIENGENGCLVPVDDVDALSAAITSMIENPQLRLRLGQRASAVRTKFSIETIMPFWESVLFPANEV